MKKYVCLALLILSCNMYGLNGVDDYFFSLHSPYRYYTGLPESKNPQNIIYSQGWSSMSHVLQKTVKTRIDGYWCSSYQLYNYEISEDVILSTSQVYTDIFGRKSSYNDQLILLAHPDYYSSWIEYNKGEKYNCKSQWIYIQYVTSNYRPDTIIDKAIKLSKTTVLSNGKKVGTYSYWIKNDALLAEFGYWGDPKKVSLIEISDDISRHAQIKEVTEKDYKTYLSIKAQREEAERIARNERIFNQFLEDLEPQPLARANSTADEVLRHFFIQLEKDRYRKQVLSGVSSLKDKSEMSITFPPESEFIIDAPKGEIDTIASKISELYEQRILKSAYVKEPITQRECEVIQYLTINNEAQITSYRYNVIKKKDTWQSADKNVLILDYIMPYVCKAAQMTYEKNRKMKKQTINVVVLYYNNEMVDIWQKITNDATETVYINLINP